MRAVLAILAALALTGCALTDAIDRATLPPPTDCAFYEVLDDGGLDCGAITEVAMTRREMDRAHGESVWGHTHRDPETRACTIYHVGEYARRVELAHTQCGRFYDEQSLAQRHAPR